MNAKENVSKTDSSTSVLVLKGSRGEYAIGEKLGMGSFGKVYKADCRNCSRTFAMKMIEKSDARGGIYEERETSNHQNLNHPHIVKFVETIDTEKHRCIAMEYLPGGTLKRHVQSRVCEREDWSRWFFQQIVFAVHFCHIKSIALRDIKLENILLDENKTIVKLCDFGFSKVCTDDKEGHTCVGTPLYAAPEVVLGRSRIRNAEAIDVWSLGVCLFFMVYGYYPFLKPNGNRRVSPSKFFVRMMSDPIEIPLVQVRSGNRKVPISEECRDLLRRILERDLEKRATLGDILEHPWFLDKLPKGADVFNKALIEAQGNCSGDKEDPCCADCGG